MSAFKIFNRFAQLLDINVTRAAAAWLRLNADGTTSQLTAAETLAAIGGISALSGPTLGEPILGGGWSYVGGVLSCNGTNATTASFPISNAITDAVFVLAFNITVRTSGSLSLWSTGYSAATLLGSMVTVASYSVMLPSSGTGAWNCVFNSQSSFNGSIGNIRILRIA